MGSLSVFVVLALTAATVLLCSQAAPVTEFFGPPQTIEGDQNVIYPDHQEKKVEEMERFHRTYKNGTVEFKMALNNGHVQYQRISSKILDGDKIQVFEGYISEQYKDGRYGTRYYAADENGYRSSGVIVENKPPKLPSSGPYAVSNPRDNENEQPSLGEEDNQTKTKTLEDNLVQIKNDLEEEQLSNLNLGSDVVRENSISTTESELLKQEENEGILEKKTDEELSVLQNSNLPASTEGPFHLKSENSFDKVSEEPESTTIPAFGEKSSIGIESESSTDRPSSEEDADLNKLETSSELPKLDVTQSFEEEIPGRSLHPSSSSDILSEGLENSKELHEESIVPSVDIVPNLEVSTELSIDNIPETTTEALVNDEVSSTEQPTSLNNEDQEIRTEVVPEINEIKTDGDTSNVYRYPTEKSVTEDGSNNNSNENEAKKSVFLNNEDQELTTNVPEIDEIKTDSETSILPKLEESTEFPIHKDSEATTTESDTSTEQSISFNKSNQELGSKDPEGDEIKIDSVNSSEPNLEESTELPIHEDSEDKTDAVTSTDQPISFNNEEQEPSTEVPFSSNFAQHIENKEINNPTEKSNNEINTENPLEENLTATIDKVSNDVTNESDDNLISDKNSRSFDVSHDLPLLVNNSTSIPEASGLEEGEHISNVSNNSETNEETTNKIETSTDNSESNEEDSNSTTVANENKLEDTTTEAEILATTRKNDIESISTERNDDNITENDLQISTEQSSEEKSTETSTEHPDESSEENDSTAKIIEVTTEEADVISTTQETEIKAHGVQVEFYHPMFYY